ncbi:MAG: UvrB/UvrC motif-containing protein [Deltaproteobacteria bacterium]|nr:UvrB/UvrC motif-containing protein [Deltaproteobacteria bacterium]
MKNRSRACLYHHLGQCPAPCVLEVSREEYAATVGKVILLLQGRSRELLRSLEAEMREAAAGLRFERAATLRDQIRAVENTVEKQAVVLVREQDLDVLGLAESQDGLALGLLFVRGGSLLGSRNFFWPKLELADAGELLLSFLLQYYTSLENMPPRVVLPWNPEAGLADKTADARAEGGRARPAEAGTEAWAGEISSREGLASLESLLSELHGQSVRINTPRNDSEEKLVRMASTNANEYARQRGEQDLPDQLAKLLDSARPIDRIEAVDVSHTAGSLTRAAMVVFEGGKPLRNDWRNYAFDNETGGGDDYAVLAAWAGRRAAAGPPWPDLLLIDGGRGQIGTVYKAFAELGLAGEFCLAGIAKARDDEGRSDRRAGNIEDRIFVPGRSNPLGFKPGSPELLFLQHVRNHVHDFVLGRHRQARNNQALKGELARIPGFGPGLARALWDKFDSLQAMAEADNDALRAVPGLGATRIKALREHLALVLK